MQKTLAREEHIIYGVREIDANVQRSKVEGQKKFVKKCVKMSQWKAVMEIGLRDSVVAHYSDGKDAAVKPNVPRVTLCLPPSEDERACALFHNELMRLCLLPLSTLVDRIREKTQKKRPVHVDADASQAQMAKEPRLESVPPQQCSSASLGDCKHL